MSAPPAPAQGGNDFFGSGLPSNDTWNSGGSSTPQASTDYAASNDFFGSGLPGNKPVQTSAPQQSYSAPAPRASTGGAFFADHTPRVEPPSTTYSQSIANQPVIRPASRGFFDDWKSPSKGAAPARAASPVAGTGKGFFDAWGSDKPRAASPVAGTGKGFFDNFSSPASSGSSSTDFFGSGLPDNKPVQTSAPQQSYSAPASSGHAANDFFGSGLPDNKPVQTSAPQQSYSAPAPAVSTGKGFFD